MQFTTSLIPCEKAIPGSSVEPCQERRVVHAEFYDQRHRSGRLLSEQDFVQDEAFCTSKLKEALRLTCEVCVDRAFFNTDLCNTIMNDFSTVPPGITSSFVQGVEAVQFQ
ncbi:hypothetical protein DL764_001149 [Monosporascus ibericus]|uniref:Uncharacterized protein n=1 Tax=Monosporascus ibericus TaxID=155417 RepID=A0A4Q4TVX0_9PEZI|nr:hypothetical protein DL764_001149 [Monosporascus ibericus]